MVSEGGGRYCCGTGGRYWFHGDGLGWLMLRRGGEQISLIKQFYMTTFPAIFSKIRTDAPSQKGEAEKTYFALISNGSSCRLKMFFLVDSRMRKVKLITYIDNKRFESASHSQQ